MDVQWYPGHMTKTLRMLKENISLVDIVVELLDARLPQSSKNPDIAKLAENKKKIALLNKSDLADEKSNLLWRDYYQSIGYSVIITDAQKGSGLNDIYVLSKELMREKHERLRERGRIFTPIRAMIVGIPNVGKSTLINKFVGRTVAKVADRPGVTRGKQWIKIKADFELLDTPGILWHKFDDPRAGLLLALTGAINDSILDSQTLAAELIKLLCEIKPVSFKNRFGVDVSKEESPTEILEKIGAARGFKKAGGVIDMERAAIILIDEFRGGLLGRITLELPPLEI